MMPSFELSQAEAVLKNYPLNIPTCFIAENFKRKEDNCVVINLVIKESPVRFDEYFGRADLEETWLVCPSQEKTQTPNQC